MSKYNCEKCGKEFNQKSRYTTHIHKKNPCVVENNTKEIIDNVVKEKLIEIKKIIPCDIINNNNIQIVYDNKVVKEVSSKKIHIPKPILKWVGGKTQIIDKLIADFPVEINNYHEAFLGGGSVLLTLLSYVKNGIIKIHGNIYAYDLNEALVYVYKNIQTHHFKLYDTLQNIIMDFNECGNGTINRTPKNIQEAKLAKENYYYWIRSEYNNLCTNDKKDALGSAMFIFLNKTCFRGVFRVGPKGFNVPYGHYNNPEIINKEHLEEIHHLIQNVVFECCDFNTSLTKIEPNDFVYLDPPYAPETDTSFVGYTENGFNIENHNNLFKLIHVLTDTNKKIMLSNADVSLVRDNFTNEKYKITSILCKRSINSKKPDAKAKEVIIKNY
uniref:site-specific DNA-methyltransferase (adenine-specific) n=1 Tax=viral metagenome TaxID=1070528 RepID=A0A6C0CUG7_9ZZZZ